MAGAAAVVVVDLGTGALKEAVMIQELEASQGLLGAAAGE